MPSSDTSDLSKSLVGLSWESSSSPTSGDTFISVTFGGSHSIDHFVWLENGIDWNLVFEQSGGEVNLLIDSSSIDLDFTDVWSSGFSVSNLGDLSVSKNSNDGSILLEVIKKACYIM